MEKLFEDIYKLNENFSIEGNRSNMTREARNIATAFDNFVNTVKENGGEIGNNARAKFQPEWDQGGAYGNQKRWGDSFKFDFSINLSNRKRMSRPDARALKTWKEEN